MKIHLLISSAIILVLSGCAVSDHDAVQEGSPEEIEIVGAWNWVESIHGWTGRTVLPESAGYTQRLTFSEDGSFLHFRADTLEASGVYRITKQDDHFEVTYEIEGRDFYPDQRVTLKKKDLIELVNQCIDCPSSIYERIK